MECYWSHRQINCSNYFDEQYTSYGKCYTFNRHKVTRRYGAPLEVATSGSEQGLWVRINVEQHEYAVSNVLSAGIKALIHDQSEEPLVRELGFAVQPGVEALVAVSNFLLIVYSSFDKKQNIMFNIKLLIGRCSFSIFLLAASINQRCHKSCLPPCLLTKYTVQVSTAMMPSNRVGQFLEKQNISLTRLRENFIDMRIYFEDLEIEHFYQEPEYEWQQLIADVGGQLGFCLGASILSVYELFEFLIILPLKMCKRKRNISTRVTVQKSVDTIL
ncbi:acid-sensing ion channel 2-like [Tubulanus polymorphus]|uniref:acid-sensing ion channel 2-like n=1 Tax=Tubulanus polymorphus TaxID=672921 RepID=UPI003DA5F082